MLDIKQMIYFECVQCVKYCKAGMQDILGVLAVLGVKQMVFRVFPCLKYRIPDILGVVHCIPDKD